MKRKLLAFAVLTALSAGAMAGGTYQQDRAIGPRTAIPDGSTIVTAPAGATIVTPEPSASAGSSVAYATPANPPLVTSSPSPASVTKFPGQSGPGANDKLRPGMPDDANNHSSWDVGTSSAGG